MYEPNQFEGTASIRRSVWESAQNQHTLTKQ